jgi:hypothetical protein
MAKATILSVGGVVVSSSGGQTGALLKSINAAAGGRTPTTVLPNATSLPAAPTTGGVQTLVIPASYTGPLSIPSGYTYVIYGGTSPVSGGDANTVLVGNNLTYTGSAGSVVGAGTGGSVIDNTNGAVLSFFGAYSVSASGNNDTVKIDPGSPVQVKLTGSGSEVDLGAVGGAASASAAAAAAVIATTTVELTAPTTPGGGADTVKAEVGTSNLLYVKTATDIIATGGATTVVTGTGGVVTLNATGGSQLIFDHPGGGGNMINAGPATEYVTAVSVPASTFNAMAGGADTIFASSAIGYSNAGGTAASLFFLGGAGAVTVSAAAAETVFGGKGGGSYSVGATSFEFFGGGGADSISGGAGASSVLAFGSSNENLTITQAASTKGNTFVSFGNNDTINAANAAGGNTWQIVNQTLPAAAGGTFTGNSTLMGSSAGGDTFVVYIDGSAPPAHTITIENWQASDVLFISNLASASQSLGASDVAAVNAFQTGGSSSLTLSDGTTIAFQGAKPTTIAHL